MPEAAFLVSSSLVLLLTFMFASKLVQGGGTGYIRMLTWSYAATSLMSLGEEHKKQSRKCFLQPFPVVTQ